MFQDFEDRSDPTATARRLSALREILKARGLSVFLVPRADEHQGEYVPPRAERLAWLTGFSGSAGLAIILPERAVLFVDGRYTLQARDQVDPKLVEVIHIVDKTPQAWLEANIGANATIGYDPWLHTPDAVTRYADALKRAKAKLVPATPNPLDEVWSDQPPPPLEPARVHELVYAGRASSEKRTEIAGLLMQTDADAAVLTLPDSIAWLLNIRGSDVKHSPLVLCFAIIHADAKVELFIDRRKLTADVIGHLGNGVTILAPSKFPDALAELGAAKKRVRADPQTAAAAVFDALERAGAEILRGSDPCLLPKACKNPVELEGMRQAHIRDGAALTRFLAWLAREAPRGTVDEIAAARKLESLRAETGKLEDLSFDTISGTGPNGAIVHYRVTARTNRVLKPGELYLVDSGAQYRDGTTDVTRAVAIGAPPAEARRSFSLVLKGHIALARARFPEGTNGAQLDTLARIALWQAGLDFDHGTGHGVGSFLSVHEGPQRISKGGHDVALKAGMVVSNEPGYYKTGAYGIRIENLMAVTRSETVAGGERAMMGFETLTQAPIDINLVDRDLLSPDERQWLNAYHARVRDTLSPLVDDETRAWLSEATKPI
jgi:Xaa-Pro aminopeptidase